jgi:hypothetical protein
MGTPRTVVVGLGLAVFVAASWALRFVGHGGFPAIDALLYFLPLYEATYARVAAGTMPLWNPYQLCGEPWPALLQAGLFYPGHLLYLLLPLPTAYAVGGVLHLVVAALATAAFCRRAGLGVLAAGLAAVVFTVRGRMSYALIQPNFLEAAAWLPLGALAVLEIAGGRYRAGAGLLAIATGLSLLAGYPQPTVYMVYAWSLLLVAMLAGRRAPWRGCVAAGAAFAGGGALGALAAAVQLLPAAELSRLGVRAATELDAHTIGMMSIITPAPAILGRGAIAGDPHAYGVTALALAACAVATVRRRALAVFALGLAVITGLFAIAGWGPLFGVYLALPLLGWFRYPHRILILTDFAMAIAVAVGFDALARARDGTGRTSRIAAGVAAGAIVVVAILARRGWAPEPTLPAIYAVAVAALVAVALVTRGGRTRALAACAVALLVVGEISWTGWHGVRLPYTAADVGAYERFAAGYDDLAARAGSGRVWTYGNTLMAPYAAKLATRHRFRAINDYEPLATRRQAEYFNYLTEGAPDLARPPYIFQGGGNTLEPPPGVAPAATRRRLLDLAAVRFVTVPAGRVAASTPEAAFVRDGGLRRVPEAVPGLELYENPHALPRAFVTYRAADAPPPAELLARIARPDFDPLVETYVEGAPAWPPGVAAPRGGPATIVRDEETVVEIDATLERDGFVVLADAFYPGWRATVDGVPAPVYATNHLFRGVPVPPGAHRVRLEYRSRTLPAGGAISVLALLAIALVARSRTVRLSAESTDRRTGRG